MIGASVRESIAAIEAEQQRRAARAAHVDRYRRFYNSRAWRAARYQFLKKQSRPLRCAACTATTAVCVDHVVPIKRAWDRRLDQTNFQLLCNDCNLAKASSDQTDFRSNASTEAAPCG
jgi:5-methylcytosine-specific restriction endonuclease McrA